MALYGQSADGIREDLGLILERLRVLEGKGGAGGGAGKPGPAGPVGPKGKDGTIITPATAPATPTLANVVAALKTAGVFK